MNGARLSVGNCLKLAALLGDDPAGVLRAYRYTAEADALDKAYAAQGKMTTSQIDVATRYRSLSPRWQRWLKDALDLLERRPAE
jgi:hypothetical protein